MTIPAKVENEVTSFADSRGSIEKTTRSLAGVKKSRVTLAESGSNQTIARIARRYQREQRIVIFEDGAQISATCPSF